MRKPHLVRKKYTMPKGHCIESITMREIDGEDELEVGRFLAARGNATELASQVVLVENIRIAIDEVNGQPIEQPYMEMDKWPVKTRRLLMEAWVQLNGVDNDEVKNFLEAANQT
jgi:hypothetical protein